MSADILSLSKHRKARAKAEAEQKAAENRILFGQTKAEKDKRKREAEQRARLLAGHQLTDQATRDGKD